MHKSKVVDGSGLRGVSALHPEIGLQPPANLVVAGPGRSGFVGTCETSLIDWIQLIQMGRRDAVIRLVNHDGKRGTLWCRDGDIIDATCDGLAGENAVYRALTWIGGSVSVEFADFSRRRAILTATAALLLGAAYREDSAGHDLQQSQGLAVAPDEPGSTAGTAMGASSAPARRMADRPPAWFIGATCGFLALLLTARLISNGTFRARPQNLVVTTSAHDLPVPTAVTRGNEARQLPAGRVELGSSEVSVGAFEQIRQLVPPRPTTTEATRKRPRATKAGAARSAGTSAATNSASMEAAVAPARVQIIGDRPPRIQIIGERRVHADALD